jgi:hypothetical protein
VGCALEACGYSTHLREIRSYSKLLGEGVTLIGNEMVHILEHVLPARFGGTPLDYQLSEEEDSEGLTRLYLVISPRVAIRRDDEVIDGTARGASLIIAGRPASPAHVWEAGPHASSQTRGAGVGLRRGKMLPLHIQPQPAASMTEVQQDSADFTD